MRIPALLIAALLAFTLTACQSLPPTAAADEAAILESIVALDAQVTVLAANVDVLSDRVVGMDERLTSRVTALIGAATDLNALVQQPLSVADVDLTAIEGLIVTTTPEAINFLLIEPGACPADLPVSRSKTAGGELLVSSFWPAPTGPHCISSPGGDGWGPFGAVVDVPPGTVGSVALLPPNPPVE